MSTRITQRQALVLGLVVLLTLVLGGAGLAALAVKDRLWSTGYDVTLNVADAADLPPGTPVRIRGVDAGQVVAVNDDSEVVQLTLRLDARYRGRLHADATARVQPIGLLGSKAIALTPGTPAAGPLQNALSLTPTPSLESVTAKLDSITTEAGALLKDARQGQGTLGKLVNDDTLYTKATAAVGQLESEAKNVRSLVSDGRETLRSVRQNSDAVSRLPVVRSYVENAATLMVRPECRKHQFDYQPDDLFEPGTAILHATGQEHVRNLAEHLKAEKSKLEIVVAAMTDPNDAKWSGAAAQELSRKQAEVLSDALKAAGAHKTGFWQKNRPVTPIGLGNGPSPLDGPEKARVQVLAFQVG